MKAFAIALPVRTCVASLAIALAACTHTVVTSQSFAHPTPLRTAGIDKSAGQLDDMSLATSALQNGDPSLAASLFEKIIDKRPHDVDALNGLGAALAMSGDTERARRSYEKAAALAPDSTVATIGLARLDLHERRLDDAVSRYERVLARDPGNALASAGLGTAFAVKGDEQRAQTIFGQALQLHPGDRMLTVDLGLAMVLGGELRKGANLLLTVSGEPSAPPQARHDLALAYGMLGNDGAADKILMRDLPRASTDDNLTYYKIVRARLGDAPQANVPVAVQGAPRKIGVHPIALSAASPIEPPSAVAMSQNLAAARATQSAFAHAPAADNVSLALARDVPRLARTADATQQAASMRGESAEPSVDDSAAPAPWQLHGQTRLLQSH
jgi:Flp pilus assembly protein TadD